MAVENEFRTLYVRRKELDDLIDLMDKKAAEREAEATEVMDGVRDFETKIKKLCLEICS